ncbi:hypothetical protein HPB48_017730 [Haemaphysalis longicornis]|uniref:DUF5641 domain-containing protein n=1 Tax=Haemaphysalis longicornis TaxID=44386 RepID=A0A9J6G1S3_HAELO|nr:hypothetical protein HPB48_017730 [Haemaphysalis longicornis]
MLDHFWNRQRKEYLLSVRYAYSSNSSQSSHVRAGDVVLVQEDKAPRHMWKMGRVLEMYPGRDNVVRACMVKLPNGATLRRPVQLLYPMELVD